MSVRVTAWFIAAGAALTVGLGTTTMTTTTHPDGSGVSLHPAAAPFAGQSGQDIPTGPPPVLNDLPWT
ncbi:hypothetical protein [Streptomyces katsurahamanus]|uniref:Uncharacterized protein n=1 Tax=Streptomyces katsurahamanus TaxID=2577098 RepID=A0ABW9NNN4_9ACTN|nr:hypothetical protein [Streptomyces katsurahamanus]MQS34654.1 hypothetical protein [Streptomyces katsurahamanus]